MNVDLGELLRKQEALADELAACVGQCGAFPVLKHPLVMHVPYFPQLNAYINRQLAAKTEALLNAVLKNDLTQIVVLHERPWRVDALTQYGHLASDADYWETLGWAYTDSENIAENWPQWQRLLASPRPGREHIMSAEDRAIFAELPDTFMVYRGGMPDEPVSDASWTLDFDVARWFARRFDQAGCVLKGRVNKSDVIAYMGGRHEAEIMVHPSKVQNVCTVEALAARPRRRTDG